MIVKLAYQYDIDAVSLLLFRVLFALPFYLAVFFYRRKEWKTKPLNKNQKLALLSIGILGYYLASYFDFVGLSYITASLERLILFTYPALVLIFSAAFLKKKIKGIQILSILITYAGIAVIFSDQGGITVGSTDDLITGTAFVGLSALCYAGYLVISYGTVQGIGSVRLTTWSMIISCICVGIHFLVTTSTNLFGYAPEVYWLSLLMAVIATVIPSFLINEGIRRFGAPNVSIVANIGPVSTIILSMILLGEMMTLIQFGGATVILVGVGIISLSRNGTKY